MQIETSKKINVFTLGCSKNRVDSEVLIKQLSLNGYLVEHESQKTNFNYIIINTCGFIGDAKEESINTILNFAQARKSGKIEKLVVFGCLSQRYKSELAVEIPEVDAWFGKFELDKMLGYFNTEFIKSTPSRTITTPKHYAYLKISEGCNRTCSFCAIPLITGKHVSRPIDELVDETRELVKSGVKEIILIAQDLSYYGLDLYKTSKLAELTDKIASVKGVEWLRLHYFYPANFPVDILPIINKHDNICKYIDIAFQHISNNMLIKMRRNITSQNTYKLINKIREQVPGIAIRTTILTGHPGETENDFEELKQFVENTKFDRLGVFTYSHEDDTYSFLNYSDDVSDDVKQQRADTIMLLQQQISGMLNHKKIGKTFKTIIDRKEGDYYIGRTEFDSPEVDNEVLIKSTSKLKPGIFINTIITKADDYDLYAEPV